MSSMQLIGSICAIILICILAYPQAKKAFSRDARHSESDAIHWGLLSIMPGICRDEYSATDRSKNINVSRHTIKGKYDGKEFIFRVWVSENKGHNVMTGIDGEDGNPFSVKSAARFTEVHLITVYKNDKFISRLTRWSCRVLGRNSRKR